MKTRKIYVTDMGKGIFIEKETDNLYIYDNEKLVDDKSCKEHNVIDDFRDKNDNVEFFIIEE